MRRITGITLKLNHKLNIESGDMLVMCGDMWESWNYIKALLQILKYHSHSDFLPSFDVGRTAVAYFPLQCLNQCIRLVAH